MNCKKCGSVITNLDQTCPSCGEPNELFVGNGTTETPETPVSPIPSAPVEPVPAAPEVPVTPETTSVDTSIPTVPAPSVEVPPVEPAPVAPAAPVPPVSESVEAAVTPEPAIPEVPVTPMAEASVTPEPSMPMQTPANPLNKMPEPSVAETTVPATPEKPKKNGLFVVVVILAILTIVGVGVFVGIKLLGGDVKDKEIPTKKENTKKEEVVKQDTISFAGLTFTVPVGMTTKTDGQVLTLKNVKEGFSFTIYGITDEVKLEDIKAEYTPKEAEIKSGIEAQTATYVGSMDYTLVGRKYFGTSYYKDAVYSETFYTMILEKCLVFGEISYNASAKDTSYKSLNDFLSSGVVPKTGTFSKNITKEQLLGRKIVVKNVIE